RVPRLLTSVPPELEEEFAKGYDSDPHFRRYLGRSVGNGPPQYTLGRNGLLYFRDADSRLRLCVPLALRPSILAQVHDSPWEGAHAG
ncbi:hypothetical protein CALCODRAFT_412798, partial [Calocera cornea HHB12733]